VSAADRETGFSDFVSGRCPHLVRTAYLLMGDRGHAEDLVQASLLRMFRAWGPLRAPGECGGLHAYDDGPPGIAVATSPLDRRSAIGRVA
jgi:hypothetical protein